MGVGEQLVMALSGKVMVSQSLCPFSSYVAAMFRLKPTLGQDTGPLSHRDQVFIRKAINDTKEGVQKNDSGRQLCMNRAILDAH